MFCKWLRKNVFPPQTVPIQPIACGTNYRAKYSNRLSPSGYASLSSTVATTSPSKRACGAKIIRRCRVVASRSPGCCRATKRSSISKKRSRRRTASGAKRSSSRILPQSICALERLRTGRSADGSDEPQDTSTAGRTERLGLCQSSDSGDCRGPWRFATGERYAGRWHVPDGHGES